jgi:DUF4097 and DUF4098 domain-containing protein YvlB
MKTSDAPKLFYAGLIIAACSLCGCVSILNLQSASAEKNYSWAPSTPITSIGVDISNGSILVERSSSQEILATATFEIRARTASTAASELETIELVGEQRGEGFDIFVNKPFSTTNYSVKLNLRVPEGAALDLETSNGAIRVMVSHPVIEARTKNGRIEVENSGGMVKLNSSNGQIVLRGNPEDFICRTTNGAIDVIFNETWNGVGEAYTSNGRITIEAAGAINAYVDADTSNGKINMQNVLAGVLEEGQPGLRLHTSNGAIDVRAAQPPVVAAQP